MLEPGLESVHVCPSRSGIGSNRTFVRVLSRVPLLFAIVEGTPARNACPDLGLRPFLSPRNPSMFVSVFSR